MPPLVRAPLDALRLRSGRSLCATLLCLAACADSARPVATPPPPPPTPSPMPMPTGAAQISLDSRLLSPAFSPDIHDYVLRCNSGPNQIAVTLSPPPGGTAAFVQPAAAGTQATLTLQEDQLALFDMTDASGISSRYNLRCLPHDFPVLQVTATAGLTPAPGYYLLGTALQQAEGSFAMVLDTHGTPVWYRRTPEGALNVSAFDSNTIAHVGLIGPFFGVDPQGMYSIRHLDSGATETVQAVEMPIDMHELKRLPNGDRLFLSYPYVNNVDLSALPGFSDASTMADGVIQELDPAGNLVWEWRASEHIDPLTESTFPQNLMVKGQTIADVFHLNSLALTHDGNVLVSARHLDAVFLIDRQSGRIRWKLGGAPVSKDGAQIITINGDPGNGFFRQHDARLTADGTLSLFDDRSGVMGPARGVVYALDLGKGTARFLRHYEGTVGSQAMGSFSPAPGGGGTVGWGAPASGNLTLTEFSADGSTVLSVALPSGVLSYRALKVGPEELAIDLLRSDVARP